MPPTVVTIFPVARLRQPLARPHFCGGARRLSPEGRVASAHAPRCCGAATLPLAPSLSAPLLPTPLPPAASLTATHHCQLRIVAKHHRSIAALPSPQLCLATVQPASEAAVAVVHGLLEVRLLGKQG